MNKPELKIAAALLSLAADTFANHECNDFDLHEYLTPKEALNLQKQFHTWNGDPQEAPTNEKDARWANNACLMEYLARKLKTNP